MSGQAKTGTIPVGMKAVASLAWPVMTTMVSHTLMSLADTLYVAGLGTAALAAVGIAATGFMVLTSFGMGLLGGVKIAVAQRTGADEPERATELARQGLLLAITVGVATAAIGLESGWLLGWIVEDAAVARLADAYWVPRVLFSPALFVFVAVRQGMQGASDTRTPMVASLIANGLNIAIDPILIFGLGPVPGLGIAGAAWASAFAEGVGMLWLLGRSRRQGALWRRPEARGLGEIWEFGFPMGLRWLLDTGSFALFAVLLARLGAEQLAAHLVVVRIISLSFLPGYAIAEAASILTGQCVGAKRWGEAGRALRSSLALAVGFMVLCGVLFALAPALLVAPFRAESEVALVAEQLLLVAAGFQIFDAIAMVSQSAISGAGDTRFVAVSGVAVGWAVKLPLSYGLAVCLGMGAVGAWMGLAVEFAVLSAVCLHRVHSGRWLMRGQLAS